MVRHIGGEIKRRFPICEMMMSREVILFAFNEADRRAMLLFRSRLEVTD
jgi:hypothetical protein